MELNIKELKYIINESSRKLLTEISNNAIETLLKKYNQYLIDVFNVSFNDASDPSSPFYGAFNYISSILGITVEELKENGDKKIKDLLRLKLMNEFRINRGNGPVKYFRGIIRIACGELYRFNHMLDRGMVHKYNVFREIVDYIDTNNIEMSEDLDGLSFRDLNRKLGVLIRVGAYNKWKNEKATVPKEMKFGEYTVIRIDSHEEASKYSRYTTWCITQRQGYYDDYASDGSQFFFCLKDGFESVPCEVGENVPLDEYGLSMVSVCMRTNGEPKCITTRWNHSYGGENHSNLRTLQQVERMLGIPESVFNVTIAPKFNYYDLNHLLTNTDIDIEPYITSKRDLFGGYVLYRVDDTEDREGLKYNVFKDGKFLWDEWGDNVNVVSEKEVWQYVSKKGYKLWTPNGFLTNNFISSNMCPDSLFGENNYFVVRNDDLKYQIVDRSGKKMLPYDDITDIMFSNRTKYVAIYRDALANLLDKNLNILWDEWLNEIWISLGLINDGIVKVENDMTGRMTYLDLETGKRITDIEFDRGRKFMNGYACVGNNKKFNFLNKNGELVLNNWIDRVEAFPNGVHLCETGGKESFFYKGVMSQEWLSLRDICDNNGNCFYGLASDGRDGFIVGLDGKAIVKIPHAFEKALSSNDGKYIFVYIIEGWDWRINILKPDGTYVFNEFLKIITDDAMEDIIRTKNSANQTYSINRITGEVE